MVFGVTFFRSLRASLILPFQRKREVSVFALFCYFDDGILTVTLNNNILKKIYMDLKK